MRFASHKSFTSSSMTVHGLRIFLGSAKESSCHGNNIKTRFASHEKEVFGRFQAPTLFGNGSWGSYGFISDAGDDDADGDGGDDDDDADGDDC